MSIRGTVICFRLTWLSRELFSDVNLIRVDREDWELRGMVRPGGLRFRERASTWNSWEFVSFYIDFYRSDRLFELDVKGILFRV